MAFSMQQEQRLRQEHRLIMTQQMQQSIKLLQMNAMELEQVTNLEMLENPFLELSDEDDSGEDTQAEREMEAGAPDDQDSERESREDDFQSDDTEPDSSFSEAAESGNVPVGESLSSLDEMPEAPPDLEVAPEHFNDVDVNWDDYFEDGASAGTYTPRISEPEEEERSISDYVATRQSLRDSLLWQLSASVPDDETRRVGEYIIGNIEDDGYLRVPLEELAADLNTDVQRIEEALCLIQTFEPAGVGARNLQECLLIQLRSQKSPDPVMLKLLENHFVDLMAKKFREVARAAGVDQSVVSEIFHRVAKLEPRPGRSRSTDEPRYILPDVVVKKVDDDYHIFVNEGRSRGLRISSYYRSILQSGGMGTSKDKEFALEKFRSAVWLIKNIEKRKSTVLKVTQAIMDFQRDFLDKGTRYLRPLTLKEVAEVVGMHESTVARVTSSKYVETPRGIFDLKYFFSPGLETDSGEAASSTAIKDILKQLITSEDPRKPLSDQRLAELIQARGITIARRTVAKYREQMKILSAKLRKQVP